MASGVVVGLGNPLRADDGVGLVLLERLQTLSKPSWSAVRFVDAGTGGLSLLHLFSEHDRVVIIDAADFKGRAGDARVVSAEEVLDHPQQLQVRLTHEPGLVEALRLAKNLGSLPSDITIFAVQPKDLSYRQGLSPRLTERLEALLGALVPLVDRLAAGRS